MERSADAVNDVSVDTTEIFTSLDDNSRYLSLRTKVDTQRNNLSKPNR